MINEHCNNFIENKNMYQVEYFKLKIIMDERNKNKTAANSVYNQLLGIKLRTVSLWVALVYLDTESLWQRK